MIPKDPVMLFSFVNTWFRDNGGDVKDFLRTHGLEDKDWEKMVDSLSTAGFRFDEEKLKFV